MGFSQGMQLFGTNLQKFKLSNTTRDVKVAVDISGWIHAISSKAKNPDSSFDVEKIIRLTVLRLICLRNKHLVPIAVFDGLTPPAKKRRPSATNNNNTLKLTPEHRSSLIIRLIEHEIEYIVAPFEADSQIATIDKLGLKTTEEQRIRKDST